MNNEEKKIKQAAIGDGGFKPILGIDVQEWIEDYETGLRYPVMRSNGSTDPDDTPKHIMDLVANRRNELQAIHLRKWLEVQDDERAWDRSHPVPAGEPV